MAERRLPTTAALLAMAVLNVGGIFLLIFERVEEKVKHPPRGLAALDPSYAWRSAIETEGVQTESRYGLGQLPPPEPGEVLVILPQATTTERVIADHLCGWVEQGGHLVFFTPQPESLWEGLAALFGGGGADESPTKESPNPLEPENPESPLPLEGETEVEEAELAADRPEPREAPLAAACGFSVTAWEDLAPFPNEPPPTRETLTRFEGGGLIRDLNISGEYPWSPSVGPADLIWEGSGASETRALAIRHRYGAGVATLILDGEPFETANLREHPDNYLLLRTLLDDTTPLRSVVVILHGASPPLLTRLWNLAPAGLSLTLVLIVLLLWRVAVHLGPASGQALSPRRSLIEHVDGVGTYLFRTLGGGVTLRALRHRTLRQLESLLPGLQSLPPAERDHWIGTQTGLASSDLQSAFYQDFGQDPHQFLQQVRTLQRIERWARSGGNQPISSPSRSQHGAH